MRNKLAQVLTLFLLATVFSGFGAAATVDMTLFPEKASACPTNTAYYLLGITNTGSVRDTFEITSSAPDQITIAPNRVTLEPGETYTDPHVWFTPKTSVRPGDYAFTLIATSLASGERTTISGVIDVLACHAVEVTALTPEITACAADATTFDLSVRNLGRDRETFVVTTDVGSLNADEVSLEPGTSQTVRLTVREDSVGISTAHVTVRSVETYASAETTVTLNSELCYASELIGAVDDVQVCESQTQELNLVLQNTGSSTDEFTVTSNVGTLSTDSVVVEGGNSVPITLSYRPDARGITTVEVRATGKSTSIASFDVEAVNCRNVAVFLAPETSSFCEDERADYDVTVKNTGNITTSYVLTSSVGSLAVSTLELEPQESTLVDFDVDTSQLTTGGHRVQVKVRALQDDLVQDTAESELSVENCYDLNLIAVNKQASIGSGESVLLELELQNTGTRDNVYALGSDGPVWVSLKPESVAVRSGETKKVYTFAAAPFDVSGDFEFGIRADDQSGTVTQEETVRILVGTNGTEVVPEPPKPPVDNGEGVTTISGLLREIGNTLGVNAAKLIAAILLGIIVVLLIVWYELR